MSPSFPLLFFLSLLSLLSVSLSQPRGILIDCGATVGSKIDGREWFPDGNFVSAGTPRNLTMPVLVPILSTVRSFPLEKNLNRKFCYEVQVFRGAKYLVRTTYFYGGINGRDSPPVFDQIVDGTLWSVVNTTEDYARNMSSYYEGVFEAQGKTMSVCIGANRFTASDPFISALEFVILGNSVYNSTDFGKYGLTLVARNSFGYGGPLIRYPDDQFDRFWEPFNQSESTVVSNRNISVSGFWNLPPSRLFDTKLSSGQSEALELRWPSWPLPSTMYYIALYFADDRDSLFEGSRVLNISINHVTYFGNLNVTPAGATVFATQWPLSGLTMITLSPTANSNGGSLINAGEVFEVLALGGRTITRDVIALETIKNGLQNPPLDWSGDPCLPREYQWTGVTCSDGPRIRVITLNLTSMGIGGSLSPTIAKLTALTGILLGNNTLSGPLPDLSSLKMLEILHLEDNHFSGEIPSSLGDIDRLHELFLQNNNFTGQIPSNLIGKAGLNLQTSGNDFLTPSPSA
ncbi:LRR receptor-like serine/threonine-protein kinase [Tripterygium wilfordii]|uniref:LRR receptor-like serine/threonine-protein kinase n=1 Tax=Tripterygium wilfordii TaxID=458696 RepID=A0A7J7CX72_TRIWF|nr:probable LRR receptor-like serine/threonine-protein kinase At4g29180 [Tripterygium wilfordii]KAF5738624.1 LRR receptor-like serine/threonine-protein kinase [Tripterygium wilfordii]